jgi:hypothetical protein
MYHENNQEKFSPLVERLMPNATLEEKEIAERKLHVRMLPWTDLNID